MKIVLDSGAIFHSLVFERDFISRNAAQKAELTRIKDVIIKSCFKTNFDKSLELFSPIDELIVWYQFHCCSVSEILHDFQHLQTEFANLYEQGILTSQKLQYLAEGTCKRFQSIYGIAHRLSHLMGSRFISEWLSRENRRDLDGTLISISGDNVTVVDDDRR